MPAGERNAGASTGRGEVGECHTVATETTIHAARPELGTDDGPGRAPEGSPAEVVRGVVVTGALVGALVCPGVAIEPARGLDGVPRGVVEVLVVSVVFVVVVELPACRGTCEQLVSSSDPAMATAAALAANLRLRGGSTR